jgi:hypothetical protein
MAEIVRENIIIYIGVFFEAKFSLRRREILIPEPILVRRA